MWKQQKQFTFFHLPHSISSSRIWCFSSSCNEWWSCPLLGAVEVASTSAKTAKQIHEIADGGSSDDDNAAEAFEAASKKVRVSAIAKDDELSLNFVPNIFCTCFSKYYVVLVLVSQSII